MFFKCIELHPRSRTMPRRGRARSSPEAAAAPRPTSPGPQTLRRRPSWRPWRPAWCLQFFCTELHVFKVRWWIIEEAAVCRIEIEGRWSLYDGTDFLQRTLRHSCQSVFGVNSSHIDILFSAKTFAIDVLSIVVAEEEITTQVHLEVTWVRGIWISEKMSWSGASCSEKL